MAPSPMAIPSRPVYRHPVGLNVQKLGNAMPRPGWARGTSARMGMRLIRGIDERFWPDHKSPATGVLVFIFLTLELGTRIDPHIGVYVSYLMSNVCVATMPGFGGHVTVNTATLSPTRLHRGADSRSSRCVPPPTTFPVSSHSLRIPLPKFPYRHQCTIHRIPNTVPHQRHPS